VAGNDQVIFPIETYGRLSDPARWLLGSLVRTPSVSGVYPFDLLLCPGRGMLDHNLPEDSLSESGLSALRTPTQYPTIAQSRAVSPAQFGVQEMKNAGADVTISRPSRSGRRARLRVRSRRYSLELTHEVER
jgi:hypothetical protein